VYRRGNKLKKQGNVKVNFIYQLIYRILTVLTPLITSPYLSRVLGVEQLGKYSASQAFVNYFVVLAMLGVEKYGNRGIARIQQDFEKRTEEFWNIYIIQFCVSIVTIITYIVCVCLFFENEKKILYMLQGMWVISSLLNIGWFYFGCELFKLTVTRDIIIKILTVSAILIFVNKPEDLNCYVVIMGLSMVISQGVLWINIGKYVGHPQFNILRIKEIFPTVIYLFLPVIASSVFHTMDKTMLNFWSDDANSGYYYQADKLVSIPLEVVKAVSVVMLPRVANTLVVKGDKAAKVLLSKSGELIIFLVCALAFGIGAVAKDFVPLFFGPGYEECIVLVWWFIPVLVVKALGDCVRSQYLIPKGKDSVYLWALIAGAIANIIVNFALIRRMGAMGAVIGTLVAETVVFLVQIIGSKKELNYFHIFAVHSSYLFFAAIMFWSITIIRNIITFSTFGKVIVEIGWGILIYMLLCVLYWKRKNDSIFHRYVEGEFIRTMITKK